MRVNGADTRWSYRDVVEVFEAAGDRLDSVILPKAESPADVFFLDRLLGQIELAQGFAAGPHRHRGADRVRGGPAAGGRDRPRLSAPAGADLRTWRSVVTGLGLGQLTIGTLEREYTADVWHHALMRVLVAARVNGLLAIDGPYAAFADLPGLERSARRTGLRRQVSHSSQPDRRSIGSIRPTQPPTPAPKASCPPITRRRTAKAEAPCAMKAK
jgi:citrate lyase subunit beta / citryl-CoA lyase